MCQSSVYVILACLLCEAVVVVAGLGTTPHLKEVFMGRCWQYQGLSEQNQIDSLKMDIDCIKLWDAFKEASAFKNPCNVNDTSYDNFFKLLDNPKKLTNVSMFIHFVFFLFFLFFESILQFYVTVFDGQTIFQRVWLIKSNFKLLLFPLFTNPSYEIILLN